MVSNENTFASIFKTIGIFIIVLGIIGSLIIAAVIGHDFNFAIAIAGSISSFLFGFNLMGIGEIIRLLQSSCDKQSEIYRLMAPKQIEHKDNNQEVDKEKEVSANIAIGPDEWKCPKCGRVNKNYVGTCGCGEVKP